MSHQVQARSPSVSIQESPRTLALTMLVRAWDVAHQLGRDPWDFAEEISGLWAAGITNGDLRDLLLNGLVVHAEETSSPNSIVRTFRKIRNLSMTQRTCFVLTKTGEALARSWVLSPRHRRLRARRAADKGAHGGTLVPEWHGDVRELRVDRILVKAFHRPAPCQETVLAAFQEQQWTPRIDDPLPRVADRDATHCLHDTINHLNRNLLEPLIHFCGDGTGHGIRWKINGKDRTPWQPRNSAGPQD